MPSQNAETLFRALKRGEFAPVYYFAGAVDVLKDEAIRQIIEAVLDPSLRDFNLDQRAAPQLDPESLHSLLNTLPMMADRRVVVLRDIESLRRKTRVRSTLESYLDSPAPETVAILVQGAAEEKLDTDLARRCTTVEFTPLQPDRTLRWIAHEAKQNGIELAAEAAEHLLHVVGNDLGALRTELAKLAALGGSGAVSPDDVAALVGVRRGETLADWRDAVLAGPAARALGLTGILLQRSDVSGVKMVSLLGTTLVGVGAVRDLYDDGVRGGALSGAAFKVLLQARPFGLGEWKAEAGKWAAWAPRWPAERVRAAVAATLAADTMLKSTRISDERGVLTDLVLQLTQARREAA